MKRVLVIGAGLTGLFAAAMAARRGAEVTLVTDGRGGLELSHGCIDLLTPPLSPETFGHLLPAHPYRRAGLERIREAMDLFREFLTEQGLTYFGSLEHNLALPSAAGGIRDTGLAPLAQATGALADAGTFHLASLAHFRDFSAAFAAQRLRQRGLPVGGVVELALPNLPPGRDLYATDLARLFDDREWREETIRSWRSPLTGIQRLGVPAVLGLTGAEAARTSAEEQLGVRLFEIPTLPPSVPGLRLERALRRTAQAAGAHLIEGAHATGLVEAASIGRVTGVVYVSAGGPRPQRAEAVILATGGALHGGLVFRSHGAVQESVFDLPVEHASERGGWTAESLFASQPYSRFGVIIGDDFRPVGPDGQPLFENLFAAGGLLGGCDRTAEGSRQGIDLVSAYCAVEEALT
ncbi:MAG: hypothetical protein A2Y93_14310 [Chloroflexi bacterium RBG_13_68_17]|nr:MAG: hypothetical protein A2Y93_14310 [Chloroflexi bacterium RBG_13_68_17]